MKRTTRALSLKGTLYIGTTLLCAHSLTAQPAAPVPAPFQPLYSALSSSIDSFADTVDSSWNGVKHPVQFAAELKSASASEGERLLAPDRYTGVLLELDSLKAIGVKAVNVQLAFPVLYREYYASAAEYQRYIDFYRQLAADVRARGMKLIGRCGLVLSQEGFSTMDAGAYYRSLTLEQYKAGRIATIVSVLQQIKPDYLAVMNEPDSEAVQSWKPELSDVAESTDFLRAILNAVNASGVRGVGIGAGVGTWAARYEEFIQSFLTTGIQFLDLHVYPVNRDFLPRLIQGADLAQAAGKDIAISEAWLQKTADEELGAVPVQRLFARDPFSFWAPLDRKFLRTLVRFSHYKKLLFLSPFWSHYLHAYADYDSASGLTPLQLRSLAETLSAEAIEAGQFSTAGVAYARAIATTPDVTNPGTPSALTGYPLADNAIHLTWAASSDNTGVAGYKVYRGGNLMGTTAELYWQDIDLSPSTSYSYTVAAYDIQDNTSAPTAAVSVRTGSTPDKTPPSIPDPVHGAAVSSHHAELRWGRSTDNVKVVAYRLFRDGSRIAEVSGTSYSDAGLLPATTYSYSVAAVDNSGNVSARSAPIMVSTPPRDTQPPSIPADLAAIAGRDIVYLSWTPSTDNVAVAGYHIFRNNVRLATSPVFTYRDISVKSNTTYTYRVVAADANGNLSPPSATVTVTTPDTIPPSIPQAPRGIPLSTTEVRISWPAAVDNVKVAGYRIFRNGAYLISWGLTEYLDKGLTPATSYTYTVVAVDSSGNESAPSPGGTVSTRHPDTQSPSAPVITLIAAVSPEQINLTWSRAVDDRRVAGYQVYRDGILAGSPTAPAFADKGLAPGTAYVYTVRAVDTAGNLSPVSASRSVTTLPPPDATPPSVPGTPSVYAFSSSRLLVVWPASTDNNRVAGYRVYRNGSHIADTFFPAWLDKDLSAATPYRYTVVAVDSAGNSSAQSKPGVGTTLPGG